MKPINLLFSITIMLSAYAVQGQSQNLDKFKWQMLSAHEIQVSGWLRVQAEEDLKVGLPGRLIDINKDIANYTFARQNSLMKSNGVPSWWPGEQEGYWHEGLIHLAFQTDNKAAIKQGTQWVEDILKSQSADGYIGIYAQTARLLPVDNTDYGENGGELHAQAHCFLAMLAFYEHTGRQDVLQAVERAAQLSMKTYKDGIFGTKGKTTPQKGGNSHSATFADPMAQLYRLTGNEEYLRFITTIYDSYNKYPPRDKDFNAKTLRDPNKLFYWHGAHTTESFHMVQAAALFADKQDQDLPKLAISKLLPHLTPSGALVCDEMVDGHIGNGERLYEHCTQAELMKSFNFITQYTGDLLMPARVARIFYNAVQGARMHPLTGVQYLSRDNRMDIPAIIHQEGKTVEKGNTHFQMSTIIRPTCCPASTGRTLPYFTASTWVKSIDGGSLAVMNYAPTIVNTDINGVKVTIDEKTEYPFEDKIVFTINPQKTVEFELMVRIPAHCGLKVVSDAGADVSYRNNMLVLKKDWSRGDRIELMFDPTIILETTADGLAQYYRRAELVYALAFKSEVKAVSENPCHLDQKPSGLFEYDIRVTDKSRWGYRIDPNAEFKSVRLSGDKNHPWQKPTIGIRGQMIDQNGKPVEVTLIPEGASISRRVTFLDSSHSAKEASVIPNESEVGIGY